MKNPQPITHNSTLVYQTGRSAYHTDKHNQQPIPRTTSPATRDCSQRATGRNYSCRRLSLGVAVLFVFLWTMSYQLSNVYASGENWWNRSWGYRKSIVINNGGSSALTD